MIDDCGSSSYTFNIYRILIGITSLQEIKLSNNLKSHISILFSRYVEHLYVSMDGGKYSKRRPLVFHFKCITIGGYLDIRGALCLVSSKI